MGYIWRPTSRTFTIIGNACPLTRITTPAKVTLRKPIALESKTPKPMVVKFLGIVKFGNDHVAKIMGYGDYQIGNVTISRIYFVELLGHNLFFVGQFCDSNLELAFHQHTCFIRNLEGVDLLTGSQGNNLYTLSHEDMMVMASTSAHLNFGAINHLARQGLVRGFPKLKFENDHLCSGCAMGKSKKKSYKPKSKDTNQEKLYLLHMDLCGPIRVKSVNGKKAAGVQIPKNNLDNLHSSIEEDGTLETVDPQDLLGFLLLADKDLLFLNLLTGTLCLDALGFCE
nr:hypothetical protein [Tanacetum cinerariifolium]